jgi:hypothetical protein
MGKGGGGHAARLCLNLLRPLGSSGGAGLPTAPVSRFGPPWVGEGGSVDWTGGSRGAG